MQTYIMFDMLYTLLNHDIVTADAFAEKYEISRRTINRYIDDLSFGGIPVYSMRGACGGYCLPDDYILERTYITNEERARLANCLNATKTNFSDKLNDHLISKILALGKGDKEKYLLKTDTLIIDAGSWNNPQVYRTKIQSLSKSIDINQSVKFSYIDRHETETQRVFDPYCLVLKEGLWYVYGWCHTREDFRLFKLARIKDLMPIEESKFTRRESDVYSKLNGNFGQQDIVPFIIEFSSLILPDIEEWLGVEAISEQGTKYIAKANLYGGNVLVSKILSFGSSVKVLSPPALKEEVLVECQRILNA